MKASQPLKKRSQLSARLTCSNLTMSLSKGDQGPCHAAGAFLFQLALSASLQRKLPLHKATSLSAVPSKPITSPSRRRLGPETGVPFTRTFCAAVAEIENALAVPS